MCFACPFDVHIQKSAAVIVHTNFATIGTAMVKRQRPDTVPPLPWHLGYRDDDWYKRDHRKGVNDSDPKSAFVCSKPFGG